MLTVRQNENERHVTMRRWSSPSGSRVAFSRRLFLGESFDAEFVEVRYDNAVLTLPIPVAERAKPRKVEITTSSDETKVAAKVINGSSAAA